MLPDLKRVKRELQSHVTEYLRNRARNSPFFKDISTHFIHEGDRTRTVRSDGTQDEAGLKQATAELEIRKDEVQSLSGPERIAKLDEMSDQMLNQMTAHMVESLSEVTEKYGQTINDAGKKFTVESLFAALEKMHLDFDEEGRPTQLQFMGGETANADFRQVLEELDVSPELRRRHDEIINRKRRDFRDREANRKLVG